MACSVGSATRRFLVNGSHGDTTPELPPDENDDGARAGSGNEEAGTGQVRARGQVWCPGPANMSTHNVVTIAVAAGKAAAARP